MSAAVIAPRLLTAQEAAAYFHLSVKSFERLNVGRVPLGAAIRYDRVALDAYLDEQSGLAKPSPTPHANDDAEAALDRFTLHSADPSRRS